jgi:hypothetical protein
MTLSYAGRCLFRYASSSSPGSNPVRNLDSRVIFVPAFAHVGAAADFAVVLRTIWIYAPPNVEETRGLKLGWIRDYFIEQVLQAFTLSITWSVGTRRTMLVTSKIVEIKTEFEFDRQKNVVVGFEAPLSVVTPRSMAGC